MHLRHPTTLAVLAALLACSASAHAEEKTGRTVPAEIALQVGNAKYSAKGPAKCRTSPQASIFNVAASMYTVTQAANKDSVRLNVWQPKSGGPAMLTLHVSLAGKTHDLDTVKAGNKQTTRGTAQVKVDKAGAGATFTIDAVAADGTKISGTVKCERFNGIVAEGG